MSFINWVIDTLASEDVLDLYFILSDLVDIPISQAESVEIAYHDAMATARAQGICTKGGHAYDAQGNDLGPVGKLVI